MLHPHNSKPEEIVSHRINLFEALYNRQQETSKPASEVTIRLKKRGSEGVVTLLGVAHKTSPGDLIKEVAVGLPFQPLVAKVNGEMWDLVRPFEVAENDVELFGFDSPEGEKVFWHSSAHILGQSLELLHPGGNLGTGPATSEGFYYDIGLQEGKVLGESDAEAINAAAKSVISQKQPFQRLWLSKEEALDMFRDNKYKVELISKKVPEGGRCTAYRCGNLIDLCKGPHLMNTGVVEGFQITKNSSAYWLGDQANDSMQRVYGIAFPSNKQLEEWNLRQEELALRDHRVVGRNQDLFFTHALSPGSAFFLPHGTRIYNKLIAFLRNEYWRRGFTEVITPNIYNVELWETSGHWANYRENMFSLEVDQQQFALKPMNCPGHCLMFAHKARSYRELPIRFADFGVLHRNELKGALTGLTRVRRFQQDDAHIFCSRSDIEKEIAGCLDFVQHVYGLFGFHFALELSTRPEKFLGDIEIWNEAEKALQQALDKFGQPWKLNPGDGAFYGPKIDIHIKDALSRSHQCATIQLDFQLPQRFGLRFQTAGSGNSSAPSSSCEDECCHGDAEASSAREDTPVIIHRAILGSVERMFAILTEHTGGKWPFWLSPRQCIVIPINSSVHDYAQQIVGAVHEAGYFVDGDFSDDKLNKKIRDAQVAQYNYILVVGKKEQASATINVRKRDCAQQLEMPLPALLEEFAALTKDFK